MNTVYLQLGSNLGDRSLALSQAQLRLQEYGSIVKQSSIYEAAAWGKEDQADYLNQVLAFHTNLPPQDLLKTILEIEENMGRVRSEKWAPRSIDIDVLYFNSLVLESETLVIPHPHLASRRFVLEPLKEIAADFIHPVLSKTTRELLQDCPDLLTVKKWQYDRTAAV